jgi:hypothetical protein
LNLAENTHGPPQPVRIALLLCLLFKELCWKSKEEEEGNDVDIGHSRVKTDRKGCTGLLFSRGTSVRKARTQKQTLKWHL